MSKKASITIGISLIMIVLLATFIVNSFRRHREEIQSLWKQGTDMNIPDKSTGSIKHGLNRLKALGFEPEYILDVGANIGDWSRVMKEIYPQAKVLMLEASPTCGKDLDTTGNKYAISLVGKKNEIVEFYESPKGTGNSIYKEKTKYFTKVTPTLRHIRTIDILMESHPPVQFMKLDIQGAELDALIGAKRVLEHVEVIELEVSMVNYNEGAPLALDVLSYLDTIGFDLLDIVDFQQLRKTEHIGQVDIFVARKDSKLFSQLQNNFNSSLRRQTK
jgi:FkbM family methyltransferase